MNEFTKENRWASSEALQKTYHTCIVSIDALIQRIKADKHVSMSNTKELTLLIPNYISCIKTIICRYLQKSGYSNQRINNFSSTELFFKFKKEISKDTKEPCNLSNELFLVVLSIRNKLSHTFNQVEYISNVIERSGHKKISALLDRMSIEAKEIENLFQNKLENSIEKEIVHEVSKSRENYPFGIVY